VVVVAANAESLWAAVVVAVVRTTTAHRVTEVSEQRRSHCVDRRVTQRNLQRTGDDTSYRFERLLRLDDDTVDEH
jgi:hypothetical protein